MIKIETPIANHLRVLSLCVEVVYVDNFFFVYRELQNSTNTNFLRILFMVLN